MISTVELSNAKLQWQKAQQTLVEEQGGFNKLKTQLASNASLPLDKFDQFQLRLHATVQLLRMQRDIDITNALTPAAQNGTLLNQIHIRAGLQTTRKRGAPPPENRQAIF